MAYKQNFVQCVLRIHSVKKLSKLCQLTCKMATVNDLFLPLCFVFFFLWLFVDHFVCPLSFVRSFFPHRWFSFFYCCCFVLVPVSMELIQVYLQDKVEEILSWSLWNGSSFHFPVWTGWVGSESIKVSDTSIQMGGGKGISDLAFCFLFSLKWPTERTVCHWCVQLLLLLLLLLT